MDFSTYDISALQPPQGRAKTQQVFKAKAQKIAGKWQIVPNSETLELEKFLDVRGNEIGLKMYHKNQLVEQILTSYDAFGNLLKRQIFRSDISMDEEEEGGDDELELDDSEETYEDDMGEMEEEEIAHAESDNESGGGDSHKLRLVAEEEYVYDEFFSLIKSRSVSQSSEPFSNYDETITTTYNRAGRRVAERKETISPEKVQVVETKFNDWGMPTEMVEIENGLLVSNTVFSYGELQQELSRITTYTDQTTEELLREFDDCQNPILEIVSQRDGSAIATINKIVYY